jgi:hypothetical protein
MRYTGYQIGYIMWGKNNVSSGPTVIATTIISHVKSHVISMYLDFHFDDFYFIRKINNNIFFK